ncbi:LEPR-XLL domain-containing protein [Thiomicrospira cyclica]|uniref:Hemagluttinin repeat-containing protein n=1 Tax=Thiomicrospira cyclica (strain DSM 14477 / JCM 11371 / ALM1) TaxID=717773 RepID=F6DAG0_THICA|nr:LEPR-XLL domain-containing protein [Thiomicrospira cyclica]AEG31126.1 hemagluttinin repeat-containing protein [Thiomicrospira cyclica ALM1]
MKRHNQKTLTKQAFQLEPLEPRFLLSADPVMGAAQVALLTELDGSQGAQTEHHVEFDVNQTQQETPPVDEGDGTFNLTLAVDAPASETVTLTDGLLILDFTRTEQGLIFAPTDLNSDITLDQAWLDLAASELDQLGAAQTLQMGYADAAYTIHVGQYGLNEPLTFAHNLLLMTPAEGGHINLNQNILFEPGTGLSIIGSGNTTTINTDQIESGDINNQVNDSIEINGKRVLQSGTGNITLGTTNTSFFLGGKGDADKEDILTLNLSNQSGAKDVVIHYQIGANSVSGSETAPLDGLIINQAGNVTFERNVNIAGDLIINASGVVNFKGSLVLSGNLIIQGAEQVIFGGKVTLEGSHNERFALIETNRLDLAAGTNAFEASGYDLFIQTTDKAKSIVVGSISSPPSNSLQLSQTALDKINSNLGRLIIGHQDVLTNQAITGDLFLGGVDRGAVNFNFATEFYAQNITLVDDTNANIVTRSSKDLGLFARNNITINNELDNYFSDAVSNVLTLYSAAGAITQSTTNTDPIMANRLNIQAATGINITHAQIKSLNLVNTGSGDVSINTQAGTNPFYSNISGNLDLARAAQTDPSSSDSINITAEAGNIMLTADPALNVFRSLTTLTNNTFTSDVASGQSAVVNYASRSLSTTVLIAEGNDVIHAGTGSITLTASEAIVQNANITSAGGLVTLNAQNGSIAMLASVLTDASVGSATTGTVVLNAADHIVLGQINAKTAITLNANTNNNGTGSITSASGVGTGSNRPLNLSGETETVTLRASQGIGTDTVHLKTEIAGLLARNTLSGGIFIQETTDLEVQKGIDETNADLGAWSSGTDGNAVFTLLNGSFTATGQMLLEGASGNLLVDAKTTDKPANIAINQTVTTNNGSVSLLAANGISMAAAGLVETLALEKTIELLASSGAIAMTQGAQLKTNRGNIRLDASTNVEIGLIDARFADDRGQTPTLANQDDSTNFWGSVFIKAGTSIEDAYVPNGSDDGIVDIFAKDLRMQAGTHIGTGANHLETEILNLAAHTTNGGIYITEASVITVNQIADVAINRVATAGTATLATAGTALNGISVGSVGGAANHLVLINKAESMNIEQTVTAAGAGNIRIESESNAGVTISADVESGSGHISVLSGGVLAFGAASIKTSGGDIDLQAQGHIEFGVADARKYDGETLQAQAEWGSVIAVSNNSAILEARPPQTYHNVYANQLRLAANDSIGQHNSHLELKVAKLSAKSLGTVANAGIYLTEATAMTVGQIDAIKRVSLDGTTTDQTTTEWKNLNSAGNLVLQTIDGDLDTLSDTGAITVDGNLFLKAGGNTSDLTLGAILTNTAGHTSLEAGCDILLNANISVTADTKTIDLKAGDDIIMAENTTITSTNGNIRLEAGNSQPDDILDNGNNDIQLRTITAGTANVALIANNNGSIVDAADDSITNIFANGLILKAGTAIGSGTNHIDTSVTTLSASAGSGGVFLTESDGLIVDEVDFDVSRVNSQAVVANQNSTQEDLRTTDNGAIVLNLNTGDLTLNGTANTPGLVAMGSGNVLLNLAAGNLQANAAIDAGIGSISIHSSGSQTYTAAGDITTAGNGTIDLWAKGANSAIQMTAATTFKTNGGNIRLVAGDTNVVGGEITLGTLDARKGTEIQANWGSISLITANDIVAAANSSENIWANQLRIDAKGFGALNQAIQTEVALLAAKIGETGLYINEASTLTIGETAAITVDRVNTQAVNADQTDATLSKIVSAGHISLHTGGTLTLAQNVEATGATTIDLRAGTDSSGHLIMQSNVTVTSQNSDIRIEAGGDIQLRTVTAGTANVALIATAGSITDANNDANANVTANGLLLKAGHGIGAVVNDATNFIDTAVSFLTANAGTGGLFVSEASGLEINTVSVSVNRIHQSSVLTINQEDLRTTDNGAIVLNVFDGNLTLNGGTANTPGLVATGSGNVLLNLGAGNLQANAAIDAGIGSISIHSSGSQTYAATGDITTRETRTIDLQASAITMENGAVTSAESGNIRYVATGAMALGQLTTQGNISLSASTITDNNGAANNLTANQLRIVTTGTADGEGAGTGQDHLEVNVAKLATDIKGTGTGGLYLSEANALEIGTLDAINVNQVGTDGVTLSAITDDAQSNLSSAGNLVLQTLAGSLSMQATGGAITAAGNLLIKAGGNSSDLTLGAILTNTAGHTSLEAGRDILLNADISATADTKTIDLKAVDDIIMATDTSISSNNGNIRLEAGNANTGDSGVNGIALRTITAGTANVALIANNSGSIMDAADDSITNIFANGLILKAGTAIGSGTNHIDISVTTLSASAGSGGVFLTESDGLIVDEVDFNVSRVNSQAGVTNQNSTQEDLRTTDNGAIVLNVAAGNLTLNGGTANTPGLVADGSGNVLLNLGAGNLQANASLDAGTGSISIHSSGSQTYTAAGDITTAGSGTIDLQASEITMTDGAVTSAESGNIRYFATGAMALGQLTTQGNISLSASNITDNNGAANNLTANQLAISTTGTAAGQGAGTATDHLDISVNRLAGSVVGTGNGGLYLTQANALEIGALGTINVNQVGLNDTTLTLTTDAAQVDLTSDSNLIIHTQGNVHFASDISALANASISSGGAITQAANTQVSAVGLLLNATGNIGSSTALLKTDVEQLGISNANNAYIDNAQSVNLGQVTVADTMHLNVAGAITQAANTQLNAAGLVLNTTGDIASSSALLKTSVNQLSITHAASAYIDNAQSVNLGQVTVADTMQLTVAGAITQTANTQLSAAGLVLNATGDIASSSALLKTSVNQLGITHAANAYIDNAKAVNLSNVTATGAVHLTADGAITQTANTQISAAGLLLNATGNIGSSTAFLETNVNQLGITNANNVFIDNNKTVNLSNVSAIGDIRLKVAGNLTNVSNSLTKTLGVLNLDVAGNIGSDTNPLNIAVGQLTAITSGSSTSAFFNQQGNLRVATLNVANLVDLRVQGTVQTSDTAITTNINAQSLRLVATPLPLNAQNFSTSVITTSEQALKVAVNRFSFPAVGQNNLNAVIDSQGRVHILNLSGRLGYAMLNQSNSALALDVAAIRDLADFEFFLKPVLEIVRQESQTTPSMLQPPIATAVPSMFVSPAQITNLGSRMLFEQSSSLEPQNDAIFEQSLLMNILSTPATQNIVAPSTSLSGLALQDEDDELFEAQLAVL